MFCKECGKEMTDNKCASCGYEEAPNQEVPNQERPMYCSSCGQAISKDAVVCPFCGAPTSKFQQTQQQQQQPVINVINTNTNTNTNTSNNGCGYIHKKKWVALVLCFFLGCLGIHRFYVGKTGTGILYLFTWGICGIGALIDFFVILFGGFRDKAGQPLI